MRQLHTPDEAAAWLKSRVTGTLQSDSRDVRPGDGFIAWPGAAVDGRRFVAPAMQQGAAASLVELEGARQFGFADEAIAGFQGLKAGTGPVAAAYYEHPSRKLDVVAITGTNGKTSTAWWLAHSLSNLKLSAHMPCGLIGTLGIAKPAFTQTADTASAAAMDLRSNGLTTPDPVLLQRSLRDFLDSGLRACAMEASSIGIAERRLDGVSLKVAVFTNFTQDHLDYHGSMAAYWTAKAELFRWTGLKSAVINIDDEKGAELAAHLQGSSLDVWTLSVKAAARIRAENLVLTRSGIDFDVVEGGGRHRLATRLVGLYNVSNVLGVIAAMRALGVPLAACAQVCAELKPVPGRMECLGDDGGPLAVIDYAHTPDALAKALQALRPMADARGGQLWCVFGCGGDRDPGKRPLMGAMAASAADRVVVTSDNPRSEPPQAIIGQILLGMAGCGHVEVEGDRANAILKALVGAGGQDVVLIAGKGHEPYQDIGGVKRPFSDVETARAALARRRAGSAA